MLLALAVYDVFWVYVSPFLVSAFGGSANADTTGTRRFLQTATGTSAPDDSVMVSVAEASDNGQVLPATVDADVLLTSPSHPVLRGSKAEQLRCHTRIPAAS